MKSHNDVVQIPCAPLQKWTVLLIEIPAVLQKISESLGEHTLKSFTLSANQTVRGVFTSDILYSIKNLPKEMSFLCRKNEQWQDKYTWIEIPEQSQEIMAPPAAVVKKSDEVKFRSETYKTSISKKLEMEEVQDTEQSKY